MKKTRIFVPDIECDSCIKRIEKAIKHVNGISNYEFYLDSIDIEHEDHIKTDNLIRMMEDMGYRASLRPFERKTLKERIKDFTENQHKYSMIKKSLLYGVGTFFILLALQAVAYLGFLNNIPGFFGKYIWWLIYLDLSIASLGSAIWYIYSYKSPVTNMTGMMIGMTIAMQAGMMIGAVLGGTNGFFIGAIVGMTLAVVGGTLSGTLGGIMGAVQGMMSGIMAGTMGAMITVMMFTDNVMVFMPYYMILNVLVLIGMIFMYFEEVVEGKRDIKRRNIDFITFASASVIITAIITVIMVYGPKSPLFA